MFLRAKHIALLVLVLLTMMGLPHASRAQGFMVEPMLMQTAILPGQSWQIPLRIRNTAADGPRAVEISLVELTQFPNGGWSFRPIDDAALPEHQSSLAWTSIDRAQAEIAPLEPAEVMVRFDPPRNARGAYFAALLVETPAPPEGTPGISVRMRFLIPIIIEIQGRPARQDIKLDDVVMTFENAEGRDPTTTAHLTIHSAGETFSHVKGALRVERRSGDNWRTVTTFEVGERPIIPGVTLDLGQDLERRLPSGEYRLQGDVTVDGRRLPPLRKEIVFVGDPDIDSVAYDTELRLTPDMVRMDAVPGATRTTILNIENPGENPVTVEIGPGTPRGLIGVRMGDLIGAELSAEQWTTVRPESFTIRGGGRQNVRVISKLPAEAGEHANYYADLNLSGRYSDGQSAGQQTSVIQLQNKRVETEVSGTIEQLALAQGDGNTYAVQVRLLNTGNTHVEPLGRVYMRTPQRQVVKTVDLSSEGGMLLPLGKRVFGGEIDFTEVEPGFYALQALVDLDDGERVARQQVIEVEQETVEGEQVSRVTIREEQELPETEAETDTEHAAQDSP